MSILIRGMEMPTTCGNCWFCHAVSNEKWHCRLTGKSFASYSVGWGNENNTGENGQHPYIRRNDCPLVPVPEHGDLIDRDRLNYTMLYKENWMSGTGVEAPAVWRKDIEDAPTIILAEKEGE